MHVSILALYCCHLWFPTQMFSPTFNQDDSCSELFFYDAIFVVSWNLHSSKIVSLSSRAPRFEPLEMGTSEEDPLFSSSCFLILKNTSIHESFLLDGIWAAFPMILSICRFIRTSRPKGCSDMLFCITILHFVADLFQILEKYQPIELGPCNLMVFLAPVATVKVAFRRWSQLWRANTFIYSKKNTETQKLPFLWTGNSSSKIFMFYF